MGDALRREKDKPLAEVSRFLLLFGASIKRRYDAGELFGDDKPRIMLKYDYPWGQFLEDKELAHALDYFERVRKAPVAEERIRETLQNETSDASRVLAMLKKTAESAGLSINQLSSPVENCLSLRPEDRFDGPFQPYCQQIYAQIRTVAGQAATENSSDNDNIVSKLLE